MGRGAMGEPRSGLAPRTPSPRSVECAGDDKLAGPGDGEPSVAIPHAALDAFAASPVVGIMSVVADGCITTVTTTNRAVPDVEAGLAGGASPADVSIHTQTSKHHVPAQRLAADRARGGAGGEHQPRKGAAGDPDDTAAVELPWFHLVLVMLAVASDAFALMGPLPFLPQMCEKQLGVSPADVGYTVGLLTGAYSIANFATSWLIGHMSDLYGRKGFELMGLGVAALSTFSLGFIRHTWLALAARLLTGALNANFAISRAQIADLVPNGARAMPYAYLGATFALARTFSSAVGGLTVGLFWSEEFGDYLAPCMVLAIPSALTFVLILVFLPETHGNRRFKTAAAARESIRAQFSQWLAPLGARARSRRAAALARGDALGDGGREEEEEAGARAGEKEKLTFGQKWEKITTDPLMWRLMLANGLVSFANGFFFPGFVLFLSSSLQHHGLGLSELDTGIAFTLMGFIGFVFQVAFAKHVCVCVCVCVCV